jgi:hypothetical protein
MSQIMDRYPYLARKHNLCYEYFRYMLLTVSALQLCIREALASNLCADAGYPD